MILSESAPEELFMMISVFSFLDRMAGPTSDPRTDIPENIMSSTSGADINKISNAMICIAYFIDISS